MMEIEWGDTGKICWISHCLNIEQSNIGVIQQKTIQYVSYLWAASNLFVSVFILRPDCDGGPLRCVLSKVSECRGRCLVRAGVRERVGEGRGVSQVSTGHNPGGSFCTLDLERK